MQCVYSLVDHNWRQNVVRTKKWRSEPWSLNVTISASCDWSVAIFTTVLESQESYLTLRNLTLQIIRDFFRLHSTFARLYNAAASLASRLRSAGSLAINWPVSCLKIANRSGTRTRDSWSLPYVFTLCVYILVLIICSIKTAFQLHYATDRAHNEPLGSFFVFRLSTTVQ